MSARTAYLDAFSGLSGDMLLGAMLDAGLDLAELEGALGSLKLGGYRLSTRKTTASGISAVKFEVELLEPQPERRLGEIRTLLESSELSDPVRTAALAVFTALAQAEAKVHRTSPEQVEFHEVGAVDSIIDIVGAAWGLDRLGVGKVLVSALPMGTGFVATRHGKIPIPAPATAELLAGFPVKLQDGQAEMVTPTGAALVRALARPAPAALGFEIERVGYGAGTMSFDDRPNLLRLILGREGAGWETDELLEIGANIDDLNPQIYDYVRERLLGAGARDVIITPTLMKKGRPGVTLTVLAEATLRDAIADVLFCETTTIGLRYHRVARLKLEREVRQVQTRWGPIRVKIARRAGRPVNLAPEYEDCRRAALEHGVALKLVLRETQDAAHRQLA